MTDARAHTGAAAVRLRGPEGQASWAAVVLRALLYALAVTALVLYAPGAEHVFIYQGF